MNVIDRGKIGKKKGKRMMFGSKSQGNQRRQKFCLTNWKYGLLPKT
jgi:hypothetical protein